MEPYYERRSAEYDDWYLGAGLFADRDRPGWEEELAGVEDVVSSLPPSGCAHPRRPRCGPP
jgi:hypothetical protein